jgi:phosphoglycerate dehydrogenase-like enzyme
VKAIFATARFSPDALSVLGGLLPGWELRTCPDGELAGQVKGADVVVPIVARVGHAVLDAGTFGLIQQFGVGLDSVDVPAATERGVWVSRLPGDLTGNADGVAELAVMDLLALARRLDAARTVLASGNWSGPVGTSLVGATVVIVGLGAIGSAVARRLEPFGARLLGIRANPDSGAPAGIAEVCGPGELHRMLAGADAVICAAMYEAGAPAMFDAAAFAAMKPGAFFINVARGGMVDEDALLASLESGHVAGAGLDVFAQEPATGPLARHPKVLATPHIGGVTVQMFLASARLFAANVSRWAAGAAPEWAVNAPPSPR